MSIFVKILSCCFALFLVLCCKQKEVDKIETVVTQQKPVIYCGNYPVFVLTQRLCGSFAEVKLPFDADEVDPAYWQPNDAQLQKLQQAGLLVFNGATYEKWRPAMSLPLQKQLDMSVGLETQLLSLEASEEHEHAGEKHRHIGKDFTTWLDAELLEQQAANLYRLLSKRFSTKNTELATAYAPLRAELLSLKQVQAKLKESTGTPKKWLASHPVYNYLSRAIGVEIRSFHWEPSEMPKEEEWAKLEQQLSHSKLMLWEAEPLSEIRTRLEKLGVRILVFPLLANRPKKEQVDFFTHFESLLKQMAQVKP